jgi:hypothetical protein
MTHNVGSADRVIRVVAGLIILGAGLYFQEWWGLIGLVPIATATMRFCPLYVPLKIDTSSGK